MSRLLFGNFDFEHQLANATRAPANATLARINVELAPALIAIAEPDDLIWQPAECDASYFKTLRDAGLEPPRFLRAPETIPEKTPLVPWGWSPEMRSWGEAHGCVCDAPHESTVRRANSRLFSHELEVEWNCGLVGATVITNQDELAMTLRRQTTATSPWVLKALFGMSGRERHLGRGPELTEQTANWARRRIGRDGAVIWEPWVEQIAEAGLQFEIPRTGEPQFLGVTPLLTDDLGNYRGNRLAVDDEGQWSDAIEIAHRAAVRLQQRHHYFGPLGIDAMHYRDNSGTHRTRPLQDINARHTMGRLALGFRRYLQKDEAGTWLHVPMRKQTATWQQFLNEARQSLPHSCRLVPTSPNTIDGKPPALAHVLLIAESSTALEDCERVIGQCHKTTPSGSAF